MFKTRKLIGLMAAAAMLLAFAAPASSRAADIYTGTKQAPQVYVASGAAARNVYAFGPQVVVDANSQKDVTAGGGTVNINGNVADDLLVFGGNIDVYGNVGGSARVAGGNVRIDSKTIGEDLVIGSGTVYVGSDTKINGDVLVAGGTVIINGTVAGSIKAAGGSIFINSTVLGNVSVKAQNALQLGPNADIRGNLDYSGKYQLIRDPSAKVTGKISFSQLKGESKFPLIGFLTVAFLIKLLAELIFALLAFAIFRRKFENYMEQFHNGSYWKNVGIGLLAFIVVPVLAVILCFAIVGYYAAIFMLALYVAMLMLAWILGASYFGMWIMQKLNRGHFNISYLNIIIGIVVASFLRIIPLLGLIFALILVFSGLGVITSAINAERKK